MPMMKCPKGHTLPSAGCSPIYCKLDVRKILRNTEEVNIETNKVSESATFKEEKLAGQLEYNKDNERSNKISAIIREREIAEILEARKLVRDELVPIPELKDEAEIEKYVEKKKVQLLPAAFRELEYALHYGDDKIRRETALDILGANGLRNKGESINAGATIIFMPGSGGGDSTSPFQLPFKKNLPKTIDANIIEEGASSEKK